MGKVKNSKKHRKKLTMKAEPIQQSLVSTGVKVETQNVLADIASMDDRKRERACVIIANIFGSESSNSYVVDKMSTSDLLGKLCMRLIDSSETVRTHAAGAIRYAMCHDAVDEQDVIDVLMYMAYFNLFPNVLHCLCYSLFGTFPLPPFVTPLRNMASCRSPVVSQRMVDAGVSTRHA